MVIIDLSFVNVYLRPLCAPRKALPLSATNLIKPDPFAGNGKQTSNVYLAVDSFATAV